MVEIELFSGDCEFEVSRTGILTIKMIKKNEVIGNINLYLDDNDLMGLNNLIKDYFKDKRD